MTTVTCAWCHEENVTAPGIANHCKACGHRADRPRADCDCRGCKPAGGVAVGDEVEFLHDPFLPVGRGVVVAVAGSPAAGPYRAVVEIAPGRTVTRLVRNLRPLPVRQDSHQDSPAVPPQDS